MESVLQMNGYELINGRKVVKKHVAAIHCSNKLGLLERKVSNILLYHAFPKLKETLVHELTILELKAFLNYRSNNYLRIKNALTKLISTVIEWNLCGDKLSGDLEGWNASSILASVSVNKGVIKYQYSENIKSLLADPERYGKINLEIQSRFKSAYSLALYENCARYRGLPSTKTFEINLFRNLMGATQEVYNLFSKFEQRVLCQAITEVNTSSDIRVNPVIIRKGRKVIAIRFDLAEQKIMKRLGVKTEKRFDSVNKYPEYQEMGIPGSEIKKLLSKYGRVGVDEAVKYVKNTKQFQSGEIHNVGAYLRSAIVNGYASVNVKQEKENIELKKELHKKTQEKRLIEEHFSYVTELIKDKCMQLSSEEKERLMKEFVFKGSDYHGRLAGDGYVISEIKIDCPGLYDQRNFDSHNGGFIHFLQKNYVALFEGVQTRSDFVQKKMQELKKKVA